MKHSPLHRRTPLKRVGFKARDRQGMASKVWGSTLSRSKPLQAKNQGKLGVALARTIIKQVSDKEKLRRAEWTAAKTARANAIIDKVGYLRCEWCNQPVSEPVGHHNDRNRRHNTVENCRLLHVLCHGYIHDNNVYDVKGTL